MGNFAIPVGNIFRLLAGFSRLIPHKTPLFVPTPWPILVTNRGEEDSMSKKLIAIPEGNLMRVAATQSITTLTALKEKVRVDRKTLRAINAGQPVKETTLQSIADRLRVPLAHLVGPSTPDERKEVLSTDLYHRREITLRRLDATGLRRLVGEGTRELIAARVGELGDEPFGPEFCKVVTKRGEGIAPGKITWLLKIDQMSEEVEALLTKLEKSLDGFFGHIVQIEFSSEHEINLTEQIARVKTSTDIDRIVEDLAQKKLNIYGGSYVLWEKEVPTFEEKLAARRDPDPDLFLFPISPPTLKYTSRHTAALCITSEEQNTLTVRVATGWEPPQNFVESELDGIDFVEIDRRKVWSRKNDAVDDERSPFEWRSSPHD
jgi:hypothetical protein